MAETCSKNYDRALDLLDSWERETIRQKLREYGEKVKMLNTRTELPVTRQDVIDCTRFHATQNEEFLSLIDDLEIIGQTFYNTAIHFKTLHALICNPSAYAMKVNLANGQDTEFKTDPTVTNMKELFIKEAVTVRTPGATRKRKWNQKKNLKDLEDRSDNSDVSSSSSSSDDDDDDDDSTVVAAASSRRTPPKKLSPTQKGKSPKGPAGRVSGLL